MFSPLAPPARPTRQLITLSPHRSFSVCFTVLSDRFSQSGPTKTYTKKGSSGKDMIRTFCSNCGSAVSQFEEAIAGKTYIQAGECMHLY